jgi:hypothetical protein
MCWTENKREIDEIMMKKKKKKRYNNGITRRGKLSILELHLLAGWLAMETKEVKLL